MEFNLKIWRQKNAKAKGHFETYHISGIEEDASFLEMLDILNEQLIKEGNDPVAVERGCQSSGPVSFDHDCREGICGACSLYIDGRAHGPDDHVTTCQLFMRHFKDGATITVEPFRSAAFPVIKDLVVDRRAFDKSSRPADSSLSTQVRHRMQTPFSYLTIRQRRVWMQLLV